jgi:hypothetical protein
MGLEIQGGGRKKREKGREKKEKWFGIFYGEGKGVSVR